MFFADIQEETILEENISLEGSKSRSRSNERSYKSKPPRNKLQKKKMKINLKGPNVYKKFEKIKSMLPKSQEVQLGSNSPSKDLLQVCDGASSVGGES